MISSLSASKKFDYRSTGKLFFLIDEHFPKEIKKRWPDNAKAALEDQLKDILKGIIIVGAALEVESIRRQEFLRSSTFGIHLVKFVRNLRIDLHAADY